MVDTGEPCTALWFVDADGDGFGAGDGRVGCRPVAGEVIRGGDCNDADATVYPYGAETCDGIDQDCDGVADDGLLRVLSFADADGDGFGDGGSGVESCAVAAGRVREPGDCDDRDAGVYPGAPEVCDGVDQDCDGRIDEDLRLVVSYRDDDGDGFGVAEDVVTDCAVPSGRSGTAGDCDDSDAGVSPGAAEVCDGADQDCDGVPDNDLPVLWSYTDADGDGYGAEGSAQSGCEVPAGRVDNALDCDDSDPAVSPATTETCTCSDGIDNDGNGATDCDDPQCAEDCVGDTGR